MSCLCSCSQSHDIAGEYEKNSKTGSIQFLLKLHENGTFHFDSYSVRQIEGNGLRNKGNMPGEPSISAGMSGRGTWKAENDVIYFRTDGDTDIDHIYTLNFENTKANFKHEFSKDSSSTKAISKLEFFESGIFWINGMELKKRNQ